METTLKFNSAVCTSRAQSERLLSLGLKKETADTLYMQIDGYWVCIISQGDEEYIPYEDHLPAWSLHRLIEILNIWHLELNFNEFNNAYDQIISYFEERVKGGFINKKYLEE